ncbi:MAG: ATP-binding cassette domain-containing protein [Geminicoccaceae bacterium]|nr:MAG: ATP-binding cassette domain-containing protein [Geminicoccaceae bacterium]
MAEPILRIEGLGCQNGAAATLHGVSLRLEPGTLTALIGPDDTDKQALADTLAGRRPSHRGTLLLDGRPITRLGAVDRIRRGLVVTTDPATQVPAERLIEATVVAMAGRAPHRSRWWQRRARGARLEAARELIRFVGLGELADEAPRTLDPLGRARWSLARALALAPSVLVVDRVTRGLDAAERAVLAGLVARIAQGGIAVLWIEDDVELVGEVAEAAFVLAHGRIVAGGPIEVLAHSRVAEAAFLGEAS